MLIKRMLFAVALAMATTTVSVTPAHAASERVTRLKGDVKVAKKNLKDDEKDFKKIMKFVEGWHEVWKAGDHDKEAKWDKKIVAWLESERAENREDIAEAKEDVAEAPGPRIKAGEQEDVALEKKRARKVNEVIAELKEVQPKFYPEHRAKRPAHEKKSEALKDLLRIAKRDVKIRTEQLAELEKKLAKAKAAD